MLKYAVSIVLALGCGNKEETGATVDQEVAKQKTALAPLIEKHRAATVKVLDGLHAIHKDAMAAATVTGQEPLAEGAKFDPVATLVAPVGWFGDVNWQEKTDSNDKDSLMFSASLRLRAPELRRMLDTGVWNPSGGYALKSVEDAFRGVTRFQHAAVVRFHNYTPANIVGEKFAPASVSGDVIIYTLPAAKRVGAFPFEVVQTTEKVEVKRRESGTTALMADLRDEIKKTVDAGLAAFAVGQAPDSPPM